jgi:hypothetical protein
MKSVKRAVFASLRVTASSLGKRRLPASHPTATDEAVQREGCRCRSLGGEAPGIAASNLNFGREFLPPPDRGGAQESCRDRPSDLALAAPTAGSLREPGVVQRTRSGKDVDRRLPLGPKPGLSKLLLPRPSRGMEMQGLPAPCSRKN